MKARRKDDEVKVSIGKTLDAYIITKRRRNDFFFDQEVI